MSLRLYLSKACYRLWLPRLAHRPLNLPRSRAQLERLSARLQLPANVAIRQLQLDGVACTRFLPAEAAPLAVIFYMHGGGHVLGSPRSHARLLAEIARVCRIEVIASDHRLAPEAPFPAGYQDIQRAYQALRARDQGAAQIILMGDSAGGNFVFALLQDLCSKQQPPAAAVALSPWIDLADTRRPQIGHGRHENAHVSLILRRLVSLYAPHQDLTQPAISPHYGQYHGAPACLIQVGAEEPLRYDAELIAQRLRAYQVPVQLQIWPRAIHVFQALAPWLPEANQAIADIADFIQRTLGPRQR